MRKQSFEFQLLIILNIESPAYLNDFINLNEKIKTIKMKTISEL